MLSDPLFIVVGIACLGVLAILGGVIIFNAMVVETPNGDKVGSFAWRPIFYILGSNLAFGILLGGLPSIKLPSMGLMATPGGNPSARQAAGAGRLASATCTASPTL